MRAFMVLLALVATPLAMGVSQALPGKSACANGQGSTLRSAQGTANAHKGLCVPQDPPPPPPAVLDSDGDGVPDSLDSCPGTAPGTPVDASGCPVQTPLPPPPPPPTSGCVASGPAGPGLSIDGQVYIDASPWPGLAGWCVTLSGTDTTGATVSATTLTDVNGNYVFTGLLHGNYTVCEAVQPGWTQTFPTTGPSCATGLGWTFTNLKASAGYVWFGNLQAP